MEAFFTVPAACSSSRRPIGVEPVNEILRIVGLVVNSRPTAALAVAGMTLSRPPGSTARWANSAAASALSGVSLAGRTSDEHPAARAGATLRVIMACGKFHGVMAETTPTGCLRTRSRLVGSVVGITSP